jgi:hypothetical protein
MSDIAPASPSGAATPPPIDWMQVDATVWDPGPNRYDLVSAQYLHLQAGPRRAMVDRVARAVAPGGSLLIVAHHPSDLQTTMPRPQSPDLFFTGDEIAAQLDPDDWDTVTNAARDRSATDPHGQVVTIHDTVVRAVRRPPVTAVDH